MNNIDNEKAILEEAPDYERQLEILAEDHKVASKRRKWYTLMSSIFVCIVLIFVVSYSTLYAYIPYGENGGGSNIDIYVPDENGSEEYHCQDGECGKNKPNINVSDENSTNGTSVPVYNIDYLNNRKATFNIDLYGDKKTIFNKLNQMDDTQTYCVLNCDSDGDGWADYNIDLNGDGNPDLNIVLDPKDSTKCDLNCDLNKDTIPDTNIDIDGDNKPDINITGDDYTKPLYNIDYMGNREATFNIISGSDILNPVNKDNFDGTCTSNCDIDDDGFPDYNIKFLGSTGVINQKIGTKDSNIVDYDRGKTVDWKCYKSNSSATNCTSGTSQTNTYINIDIDGDKIPDINISNDNGVTITNQVDKLVEIDGKTYKLNEDTNGDGFPDINIDIDNDGKPDINITDNISNVCIKNCDTNHDGTPDYLIDIDDTGNNLISIGNLNYDYDFDTKYEVNIDTDYDLYPDLDIDLDGDKIPDINIDYDHDGTADFNIDTNNDGKPDINIDPYGDGVCVFNCQTESGLTNVVDNSETCTKNCDTDNDGMPDKLIDLDNDGVCDLNCDTVNDKNLDYYIDTESNLYNSTLNDDDTSNDVFIVNGVDIQAQIEELNAGDKWSKNYVVTITNNTNHAIDYKLYWTNVYNEFTTGNMRYYITKSNTEYITDEALPTEDKIINQKLTMRSKTSIKFVMHVYMYNQPYNQIQDASKSFTGKLKLDVVE